MKSRAAIQLSRSYLKKPFGGILILVSVAALMEAVSWCWAYPQKVAIVSKLGGLPHYIGKLISSVLIPESVTVSITVALLNNAHHWFRIKTVDRSWLSIARYELSFLPVLLLAFFLFNPFTQSVRYLLEQSPNYSFSDYWNTYVAGTYTRRTYILYLIPVLIIGYITLNVSLLADSRQNRPRPSH